MALHGNIERLPGLWCKATLAPLGEHLSFNLNGCSLVSAQQHARPCRDNKRYTRQKVSAAFVPPEDDVYASFTDEHSWPRHVWLVCPHTAASRRRLFTGAVFTYPALDFHQGKSVAALSRFSKEAPIESSSWLVFVLSVFAVVSSGVDTCEVAQCRFDDGCWRPLPTQWTRPSSDVGQGVAYPGRSGAVGSARTRGQGKGKGDARDQSRCGRGSKVFQSRRTSATVDRQNNWECAAS